MRSGFSCGSGEWVLEKFAKLIFLVSALYVFLAFLLSYKEYNIPFYFNLFFAKTINLTALIMLMASGFCLAYLRFKAILLDYVPNSHARIIIRGIFILANSFFLIFAILSFVYFHFIILLSAL
jgi:succinate dehydrogenase hydrophobic anchor subunit